jgi:hypothetical protein
MPETAAQIVQRGGGMPAMPLSPLSRWVDTQETNFAFP